MTEQPRTTEISAVDSVARSEIARHEGECVHWRQATQQQLKEINDALKGLRDWRLHMLQAICGGLFVVVLTLVGYLWSMSWNGS